MPTFTPNLHLTIYANNDKPKYIPYHNDDMRAIDNAYAQQEQALAQETENRQEEITQVQDSIAELEQKVETLGEGNVTAPDKAEFVLPESFGPGPYKFILDDSDGGGGGGSSGGINIDDIAFAVEGWAEAYNEVKVVNGILCGMAQYSGPAKENFAVSCNYNISCRCMVYCEPTSNTPNTIPCRFVNGASTPFTRSWTSIRLIFSTAWDPAWGGGGQ